MSRPQKPADLKDAIGSRHAKPPKPPQEAKVLEPLKLPDVIPEYLSGKAGEQWRRIVPGLFKTGTICEIDRPMLCALCHAMAIFMVCDDPSECRMLLKSVSEFGDKFNLNPKARAQSGVGGADNGVKTRNF